MTLSIRYFAWVRERIGESTAQYEGGARTVREVIEALRALSPAHELALSELDALRFALDQEMVEEDAPINAAHELAIFPPMTGG